MSTLAKAVLALALPVVAMFAQRPVISPNGVVNAASYVTRGGITFGSIGSIFGRNLASATLSASELPLPTSLGGSSVIVNGVPAPLFYVSPDQINFQVPISKNSGHSTVVVSTPAGDSDPHPNAFLPGFGIFTFDGSGCGRGLVLNVARDGSVSTNSPANSASPGDYITIFGTGLLDYYNYPPDGLPAPASPLARGDGPIFAYFDLDSPPKYVVTSFYGRAPGQIGVDQVNVRIPDTVREGCNVPVSVQVPGLAESQSVPISIRQGGGQCVEPPMAGYGLITWEKTAESGTGLVIETLTAALTGSPGKKAPDPVQFSDGRESLITEYLPPSCPLVGYINLDAGAIIAQPQAGTIVTAGSSGVSGQPGYVAKLPNGTIQPGSFKVAAAGGNDVQAFESTIQIGSGIEVTTPLPPGTVLRSTEPIIVRWTGGDPNAWVTLKVVTHWGDYDLWATKQRRASNGVAAIATSSFNPIVLPIRPGPADIYLEVTPDPANEAALPVAGLSLGGRHTWKYTYHFGGLTIR